MSYKALVCRIKTKPHPNADRVLLGDCAGFQVVVSKDTTDDQLGVFFPEGGQLSHEFCMGNNLYNKHPDTGEPMGGYFSSKRRVQAKNFRGQKSEGFWVPLHYFECVAPVDMIYTELKEGEQFDSINGHLVCNKYYTPATLRGLKNGEAKSKKSKVELPLLRHYNTKQLRFAVNDIPLNSVLYFTEKLHGTSGRTGYLHVDQPLGPLARAWNWVTPKKINVQPKQKLEYISGTRNCILNTEATGEKAKEFRQSVHESFIGQLKPGETAYYEIVGFEGQGRGPIMATHGFDGLDSKDKKKFKKKYGDKMVYSYGCDPEIGEYKVYVYRMTRTIPDGSKPVEYTWEAITNRCQEMGVHHVPLLQKASYTQSNHICHDPTHIQTIAEKLSTNDSTLDDKHIMEGVCVRAETQLSHDSPVVVGESYKFKSYWFKVLEGIVRDSDNYVDPEEIS